MGTTCKPITEAEILDLINNEEKVIKSLEHLGIYKDDGKLNAVLEYYEVFTKEEFIRFQNYVRKTFNPKSYPIQFTEKHALLPKGNFYIKLDSDEGFLFFCATNALCKKCFNAVLKAKERNFF